VAQPSTYLCDRESGMFHTRGQVVSETGTGKYPTCGCGTGSLAVSGEEDVTARSAIMI
jgi:hypothetical protein